MEKQIEEIANDINKHCVDLSYTECGAINCTSCLANALYNAGYRKISEIEKWTIREISEGIENIIAEFERLKAVGFKHDDKWRFDNLVSDIRDFLKEYEGERNG